MEPIEPKTSNSRRKNVTQISSNVEDALVGHAFGERPLLADDELDDDSLHSGLPRAPITTSRLPTVPLPFRYVDYKYIMKNNETLKSNFD